MKTKPIIIIALLAICMIIVSCEADSLTPTPQDTSLNEANNVVENGSNDNQTTYRNGKGFTLISAGLHRGKKWTKKQNEKREKLGLDPIEPCSRSFGLCNIKIGGQKKCYC